MQSGWRCPGHKEKPGVDSEMTVPPGQHHWSTAKQRENCSVRGSWYFISPQSKCDQVVSQVILPWEICLKRRRWKVSDVLWIHNLTWYLFMSPCVVPYSVTELHPEVFVWGHRCVPRQADPLYSNKPQLFTPTVLAVLSVGFYTLWWLWGFTSNSKLGTL